MLGEETRAVALGPLNDGAVVALELRVQAAQSRPADGGALRAAITEPLSEGRARALLARLPRRAPSAQPGFRLPPEGPPAPRPGESETAAFPPEETTQPPPATAPSGPLEVERIAPEGSVEVARDVQVQLSRPMVPLAAPARLDSDIPVLLEPEPPGSWRWVDPFTLVFEPEGGRLPAATEHTVTVPAGLTSEDGQVLSTARRAVFRTPPPKVVEVVPKPEAGDASTEPVIVLAFNQKVDPRAVLERARLSVDNRPGPELALASEADLARRPEARRARDRAGEGRSVALVPGAPLPTATEVRLEVAAGPWSAEGPLPAPAPFRSRFSTHGLLRVEAMECGWGDTCRPGMPLRVRLSNALLPEDRQPKPAATVTPSIPGLEVVLDERGLTLSGATEPMTTYTVRLDPGLVDEHGGRLGAVDPVVFKVEGATPFLQGPSGPLVRRLPGAAPLPILSAGTRSLRVKMHRVRPADWPAWGEVWSSGRDEKALPGEEVSSGKVAVAVPKEQIGVTKLDLEPALGPDGVGMAAVEVSAPVGRKGRLERIRLWAVVSEVLLDAWIGRDTLYVAASDPSGAPLADLEVRLEPGGPRAKTGADGLARIPLPEAPLGERPWIETDRGGFLPDSGWSRGRDFVAQAPPKPILTVLTVDDRGLYRPGETAHIKGWVRRFHPDEGLEEAPAGATASYEIRGPRGNEWTKGTLQLGPHGSFHLAVDIPRDANLGPAQVNLRMSAGDLSSWHGHALSVQEFRRPRFEVSLEVDPAPHVVGRSFGATVSASAYAGGPVADAPVRFTVTPARASYDPPGWPRYRFGASFPWWWSAGGDAGLPLFELLGRGATDPARAEGRTGPDGRARLVLEPIASQPFAAHLDLRAEVEDVDRRAVAATAGTLVHPADRYVGIRTDQTFLGKDDPLEVEVIAVDIEGRPLPGSAVAVTLHPSPGFGPTLDEIKAPVDRCALVTAEAPSTCRFKPPGAGRYLVRADVKDARGRTSRTETTVYWAGETPSVESAETETLELAPDRESFTPGDTALVTVRSPIGEARGFALVVGADIRSIAPLVISGGRGEIRVPITERLVPEVALEAWVAGGTSTRPRSAAGRIGLDVDPAGDRLTVEVVPAKRTTAPGAETAVEIRVRDATGAPVPGAEVTLAVVDEAVLALTGSEWPDPLERLLPEPGRWVRALHARESLLLDRADPRSGASIAPEPPPTRATAFALGSSSSVFGPAAESGMEKGLTGEPSPIELRADLRPMAHFEPAALTERDGRVEVRFTVPDDLTRYRARAIAATKGRAFGRGETSFVVQKPVSIQPGLPRFLSLGDRPELPYVVTNRTDAEVEVVAAIDAAGVELSGPLGLRARVPANDRVELRFPAEVRAVGQAALRAVIEAGPHTDAVKTALPIYAPVTREAFAEHGSLAGGALERRLELPEDAAKAVGGLELELSPTRLLAAKDAFRSVVTYPFLCAEQRASRLLAWAALRDLRVLFEGDDLPSAEALRAQAKADVERLVETQRPDGSWAFWPASRRPDPFLTAHVLHALLRAQKAEVAAPPEVLERAAEWLRGLPRGIPEEASPAARAAIEAHAEWVLSLRGATPGKRVEAILEAAGGAAGAPTEVLAWLYGVAVRLGGSSIQESLQRALASRIAVTAKTAHLVSAYDEAGHLVLHGAQRADAIYLLGLLEPSAGTKGTADPLVEKLLAGLLAGRGPSGAWSSTQENAWALLAVARYAAAFEGADPDMTARAWLADRLAFEGEFSSRQDPRQALTVPMSWLLEHPDARTVSLGVEGVGRLYYRLGIAFGPEDLKTEPAARGFTVRRRYEAVDDPEDVERTNDGWRVRPGARVRIRLEVVARGPRHHVALVDRLPAGLEPLHPELDRLDVPPPIDDTDADGGAFAPGWWWDWEHHNLRDTGVEVFATDLSPGLHRFTYLARATTPGRYVVAPARAEEMYAPETYGHTAAERVEVTSP